MISKEELIKQISSDKNILIVQDLDGVCIPLVKDPLDRIINIDYIMAAKKLKGIFNVLTNGEHGGYRGVNKLIENAIEGEEYINSQGIYLPGLAAGGIQLQDSKGKISTPGITNKEINFLKEVPIYMKDLLLDKLKEVLPELSDNKIKYITDSSILDTELSPTINMNSLFDLEGMNLDLIKQIQDKVYNLMEELLLISVQKGFKDNFFLHIAPNLGNKNGKELLKYATINDKGTTDIQFMIKGAIKESGLLVLINNYIENRTGKFPFGRDFNVLQAPKDISSLAKLCLDRVSIRDMPTLFGIGDTVTSTKDHTKNTYLRGGSDRGFLTLIQELGKLYNKDNRVLIVDSSYGEVDRPSMKSSLYDGITDKEDVLKFDYVFLDGTDEYINWFINLSKKIQNV